MKIPEKTEAWLLDAPEPYIRYQAQRLFDPGSADRGLLDDDPFIQRNLAIAGGWRSEVVTRHDKPDLFFHRLAMLADLGVTSETRGVASLVEDLIGNFAPDGTFPVNIMIPKAFGGSGEAHPDWVVCDFPVTLYALLLMTGGDARLKPAVQKLMDLAGESFYPCTGSIAKFKGPGPRNGMCPYANLLAARALGVDPAMRECASARKAVGAVLAHWEDRKTKKPFLFGMGTDFLKLKFPMAWYNLLHVLSALSMFPWARSDPRYREMEEQLRASLDEEGRATARSVYLAFKGEEWADKKQPSRLLTYVVHRILGLSSAH